jgi:hypothetical protein
MTMWAILAFARTDFQSHRVRWCAEFLGMVLSVGVAGLLALTTPYPPLLLCYIGWLGASGLLVTTSYHRGSFGMTALYTLFLVIDSLGLVRTLLS